MCDHDKVRQEQGDLVCVLRSCPDSAHADLIPSCCLQDTRDTPDGPVCSSCGTPTDRLDPLTREESAEVAKALRQSAAFNRQLGEAEQDGRAYRSGETAENHAQRSAKGRRRVALADRLEALAAKLEA